MLENLDGMVLVLDGLLIVLENVICSGVGKVLWIVELFVLGWCGIEVICEGLELLVNLIVIGQGCVYVSEFCICYCLLLGCEGEVLVCFLIYWLFLDVVGGG